MEIEKFKFNMELKRNRAEGTYWTLMMDQETKDLMGDPICCQKCKITISGKFYICEEYFKWFCSNCQLKGGDILKKDYLCKFDEKGGIMEEVKTAEEHTHICIKKIEYNK